MKITYEKQSPKTIIMGLMVAASFIVGAIILIVAIMDPHPYTAPLLWLIAMTCGCGCITFTALLFLWFIVWAIPFIPRGLMLLLKSVTGINIETESYDDFMSWWTDVMNPFSS